MKEREKRKTFRKIHGFTLGVAMLAGSITFMPGAIKVQAAATAKNVNLNISTSIAGIGNPTTTSGDGYWKGSKIYYGNSFYFVLDSQGTLGGHSSKENHMLLLSQGVTNNDNSRIFDDDSSDWTDTNNVIRNNLNGDWFYNKDGVFTTMEKDAIGQTTINTDNTDDGGCSEYPAGETNDKIFLLDLADVHNIDYGFNDHASTRRTHPPCNDRSWLRSPGDHNKSAAYVNDSGIILSQNGVYVNYPSSVRAAFNLELSKVLFSSANGVNKSSILAATTDGSGTITWNLTLKDGNTDFAATRTSSGDLTAGTTVSANVSSLGTAGSGVTYSQISAMLTDSDGTALAYGKISDDRGAAIGDYSITIPVGISNAVNLYIFAEDVKSSSSSNKTDYASNMIALVGTLPGSKIDNTYKTYKTSSSSASSCNHDYEWDVEKAPTETEDGEAVYKCTKCGNISARQPLTAYQYYILTSTNKIKNAKAGSTVTISSKLWNSFPKSFFEQLAKRRDITVKIDFPYDSKNYEITISPTQKIDTSDSKVKYYGPKNLIGTYNAVEVKTK